MIILKTCRLCHKFPIIISQWNLQVVEKGWVEIRQEYQQRSSSA